MISWFSLDCIKPCLSGDCNWSESISLEFSIEFFRVAVSLLWAGRMHRLAEIFEQLCLFPKSLWCRCYCMQGTSIAKLQLSTYLDEGLCFRQDSKEHFWVCFVLYSDFTVKGGQYYFALSVSRVQKKQITENFRDKWTNVQYSSLRIFSQRSSFWVLHFLQLPSQLLLCHF